MSEENRKYPMPGDTVKLKQDYKGFKYGIVVETLGEHGLSKSLPRILSIMPFNSEGEIDIVNMDNSITPECADFPIEEVILVNRREGPYQELSIDFQEECEL